MPTRVEFSLNLIICFTVKVVPTLWILVRLLCKSDSVKSVR